MSKKRHTPNKKAHIFLFSKSGWVAPFPCVPCPAAYISYCSVYKKRITETIQPFLKKPLIVFCNFTEQSLIDMLIFCFVKSATISFTIHCGIISPIFRN